MRIIKLFPSRPSGSFSFKQEFPVSYVFYKVYAAGLWDFQGWSYHFKPMFMHKSFIFTGTWQSNFGTREETW